MSVVSESPHVARPTGAQTSLDSRLRPALPVPERRLQPVVVMGTHLGVTMGFHHVLSADTEHLARKPIPNDVPRVERAEDAQYRVQELLSQMRALEMEAQASTGGTEAGRASLNAQLEQLGAEAQNAANLVRFDDVHRMTTTTIDRVSVTRTDNDTYVRRAVSTSETLERDNDRVYRNRHNSLSAHEAKDRTVSVDMPRRDNVEIRDRRIDHAREVMQRLVEHLDTQGIAFVAQQNYVPVGTALATLYAQLEHQSAWRPPKTQAAATVAPVEQTLGTRYI